jgi:hypothetical protein
LTRPFLLSARSALPDPPRVPSPHPGQCTHPATPQKLLMNQEVTSHSKTPAAEKNYLLDLAPMHFSPKQEGGGNGSNSDDKNFNFVEIDTIQDDTKNEIIIYAKF